MEEQGKGAGILTKNPFLSQCLLIIMNVKIVKTQSKTKKGQKAIILEIYSPANSLLFRL